MPLNASTHDPSGVVEAIYEAFDAFNAMLLPPGIDFTKDYFQNPSDAISVQLTNPNRPDVSEVWFESSRSRVARDRRFGIRGMPAPLS